MAMHIVAHGMSRSCYRLVSSSAAFGSDGVLLCFSACEMHAFSEVAASCCTAERFLVDVDSPGFFAGARLRFAGAVCACASRCLVAQRPRLTVAVHSANQQLPHVPTRDGTALGQDVHMRCDISAAWTRVLLGTAASSDIVNPQPDHATHRIAGGTTE